MTPIFGSPHQKSPIFLVPTPNDPLFSTKSYTEGPLFSFSGRHCTCRSFSYLSAPPPGTWPDFAATHPCVTLLKYCTIEGLTHLCAHDFAPLLGFLLHSTVRRKTKKKHAIFFYSSHKRILNFTWVFVLIFLSLSCSLVLWYELYEKLWDILLCFPMPDNGARKPPWWLRVWWLAKLAWYDVTWKPSIEPLTMHYCWVLAHFKKLCMLVLRSVRLRFKKVAWSGRLCNGWLWHWYCA